MIVDLGTGDGRAALALAEARPTNLVLAVDADGASMAERSRRAARPVARGGRPNLLFVVGAAEIPPAALHGIADEVRILFPWASLLRGVLGEEPAVARGIAALLAPNGRATALVSVARRDRVAGLDTLDADSLSGVADRLRANGLPLVEARAASAEEVRATRSTWGRRLGAGAPDRPAWWLELRRAAPMTGLPEGHREWAGV